MSPLRYDMTTVGKIEKSAKSAKSAKSNQSNHSAIDSIPQLPPGFVIPRSGIRGRSPPYMHLIIKAFGLRFRFRGMTHCAWQRLDSIFRLIRFFD
jgi:hypothetical protein